MLKRISNFFARGQHQPEFGEAVVIPSGQHALSPQMISRDARKVVQILQEHGFEAYVVGGSVRDLLLGLKPKDFDVATNAKPAEIKPLFRRARIIGRRFQIVHVQFSREPIEVTTFRSNATPGQHVEWIGSEMAKQKLRKSSTLNLPGHQATCVRSTSARCSGASNPIVQRSLT